LLLFEFPFEMQGQLKRTLSVQTDIASLRGALVDVLTVMNRVEDSGMDVGAKIDFSFSTLSAPSIDTPTAESALVEQRSQTQALMNHIVENVKDLLAWAKQTNERIRLMTQVIAVFEAIVHLHNMSTNNSSNSGNHNNGESHIKSMMMKSATVMPSNVEQ
jgi:hypothetical protein